MLDKDILSYRPCVGLMLVNADGFVFAARRIDRSENGYPDAWQMPQGGVDEGEDLPSAALRELQEETSLTPDDVVVLRRTDEPIFYDLPDELLGKIWDGTYRGQVQTWFALRLKSDDSRINIDTLEPEFDAWRWMTAADMQAAIVPFKQDVYAKVFHEFRDLVR